MNDGCWIIVDKRGIRAMAKGRKANWREPERPRLAPGQYALWIDVEVPDKVFQPRQYPSARVVVPEEAMVAPSVQVTVESPAPGGAEEEGDDILDDEDEDDLAQYDKEGPGGSL